MQASLVAQKPFAASRAASTRAAGRQAAVVRAAAGGSGAEERLSRRALAGLLAAAPVLLPASSALALIPDDDDEELVEKARANRKAKLANEKRTEQAFSRSAKGLDRVLEGELIPVQRAINSLAQSGAQLEAGDVKAAAGTLNGGWVRDFQAAADKLSYTDASKAAAAAVFDGLSGLQAAAGRGSAADAKRGFVSTVAALQKWAQDASVASELKGL